VREHTFKTLVNEDLIMTTVTKPAKANYSETDIAVLRSSYTGADNKAEVAAIAVKIGKSPASVRAKLANLGLYVKAEEVDKPKARGKADIVAEIATKIGLPEHDFDGLAKATIRPLEAILKALS
jgi:hypothetical protein